MACLASALPSSRTRKDTKSKRTRTSPTRSPFVASHLAAASSARFRKAPGISGRPPSAPSRALTPTNTSVSPSRATMPDPGMQPGSHPPVQYLVVLSLEQSGCRLDRLAQQVFHVRPPAVRGPSPLDGALWRAWRAGSGGGARGKGEAGRGTGADGAGSRKFSHASCFVREKFREASPALAPPPGSARRWRVQGRVEGEGRWRFGTVDEASGCRRPVVSGIVSRSPPRSRGVRKSIAALAGEAGPAAGCRRETRSSWERRNARPEAGTGSPRARPWARVRGGVSPGFGRLAARKGPPSGDGGRGFARRSCRGA